MLLPQMVVWLSVVTSDRVDTWAISQFLRPVTSYPLTTTTYLSSSWLISSERTNLVSFAMQMEPKVSRIVQSLLKDALPWTIAIQMESAKKMVSASAMTVLRELTVTFKLNLCQKDITRSSNLRVTSGTPLLLMLRHLMEDLILALITQWMSTSVVV